MTRVQVKPELLRWACERSRIDELELSVRFPKLDAWFRGETQPTFKQLEKFAKATHVPFGYLFLPDPPDEPLPIADFRERSPGPPSGDLLDTIYAAQRRQDWFKEYATSERLDAIEWIGCATLEQKPSEVAAHLRERFAFEPGQRKEHANWEAATRALLERVQALGVLVSVNGVVGSNPRRKLDPAEFRGFSLPDPLAPCVFVNGADHKAAHAFTLCHELAHLVLGRPGLSNEDLSEFRHEQVEAWCDAVASEILAPSDIVPGARDERAVQRTAEDLTRELRVSPLVTVRRVVERSKLPAKTFERCFRAAVEALPKASEGTGGNFYATALKRVGHRFARDVIASTLEGNTTFTEAFRLLGVRSSAAFQELSRRVGLST
jgi:Zn-dependent peptidase ImmA (M78 family)/transcriptional regulator with XRE-family HTH domain